jgi:hypothetical protein
MTRSRLVAAAAALLSLALPAGTAAGNASGDPFASASPNVLVYFVPLDAHARTLLQGVVPSLARWLPAHQTLRVASTNAAWANAARAGELNDLVMATDLLDSFRRDNGDRSVLLLSVSSKWLYAPDIPQYRFVFGGWVQPVRGEFSAVFGTAPMRAVQPERERARLQKMMLRYIGQIVCNPYLPQSSDPHSVMYTPILSTADLDRMAPTLPATCRRH